VNRPSIPELYGDGERRLLGAVFLTYTLRVSAFEEILLPRLLGLDDDPSSAAFVEEARRRLKEVPIAIAADAGQLERHGAGAFAGRCGVPIVRVQNPRGAFHPKLAVLRFDDGVRVVVGSANLTEDGLARQIELATAFELADCPGVVAPLRSVLDHLTERTSRSPAWIAAARVVRAGFPADGEDVADARLLFSKDGPILVQLLETISRDIGGKGRVEAIEITSPYFERGKEDDTLLSRLDAEVRKALPATRHLALT
jgi:hypothetical protein